MVSPNPLHPLPAESADEECRRLAEALALAERDRQLLAYEIHDGIVQDLTAAAMLLEGAASQATFSASEVRDNFARGLRLLRGSIAEARRQIRGISTIAQGGGLVTTLQRLVEKFRADHTLPVTFSADVDQLSLPTSVEHLLVRIAQESLYNVWKHAHASKVEVHLTQHEGKLTLNVTDNGVGFDPTHFPAGHFGLGGIRARASVLDAELAIDSAAGKGTRITIRLPNVN